MNALKVVGFVALIFLLLSPVNTALAESPEGSMEKHEGSMPKAVSEMQGKQMACTPEHMKMMLRQRESRMCVVDSVLEDEDTKQILMEKIAGDPKMRKAMMQKCEMMEKKPGEGSMMKQEEMMHHEGSMMKQEDSGKRK